MSLLPVLEKDELFTVRDSERIWKRYCGFLDLTIDEFMVIQETLLDEQIELAADSELGRKIMGVHRPANMQQFRAWVPFTTYEDYQPYLGQKEEGALPRKPFIWARTSGRTCFPKWAPYTIEAVNRLAHDTVAAFVISSATRKGEVHVHEGVRVVLNLPPVPYVTGIMGHAAAQVMPYRAIPPLEQAEAMEFEERIRQSFKIALHTGIDYAGSIAVVLAKVGEAFSQCGRNARVSVPSWHPLALLRLLKVVATSRLLNRPMLPRDIWKVKGLVCGGTDTAIYREQIKHYWGVDPLDVYVSTETGFVAMQGWNKKAMTFVPYTNFYEFIPEEEWLKSRQDKQYRPATVLLSEVEEGKVYEIVVTNFHGGPFLRYRIGDLVKITSLRDTETGVNLPQMTFQSRADDIIDIAGFARLDEKTIWQAIQNTGIAYVDWTVRKEYIEKEPVLHLYLELKENNLDADGVARLIDKQLSAIDNGYNDFKKMIEARPLQVTILERGAFQRYMKRKQAEGCDVAHLKPVHINPSEATIGELLNHHQ